jgi:hypothetical protein
MELRTVVQIVAWIAAVALVLAWGFLIAALRRVRKIRLPPDADFFTTVRAVPLALVVGLDFLDLALDIFSAPIIWFLLNRYNLQRLRDVATFEAIVPFTGPIPTLTLAWIAARWLNLGRAPDPNVIETEPVAPGRYAPKR